MWEGFLCLSSSHVLCVLAGFAVGVLAPRRWPQIWFARQTPTDWGIGKRNDRLYSLDHGKLNLELPPRSMWMNMGYWRDTDDFPTACQALLVEVLKKAGLLDDTADSSAPKLRPSLKSLSILDLGFGCGDQTAFLVQLARVPLKYVGINLNYRQYRFAQNRLGPKNQASKSDVQIFCEDAAQIESWPTDLRKAVASLPDKEQNSNNSHGQNETWVLALDSFYHFHPSRKPIVSLAAQDLKASVMAFDMLLSDSAAWYQRWILKLVAWMGECPINTFMTRDQYSAMLAEAGYDRSHIEFYEVTEDVFEPLARYMDKRGDELEDMGMMLGSLNIARLVFDWWARSRVLEAVIVVARISSEQSERKGVC
ncbi:methyltransferase domain-containing protein [Apiospora kogelbergensis]|uniref:Methyltransferase domain-containing protein n=1 Tax=Apiospora kogelbergensis TaxID=1337665 RepID=A0AAW0REH4_9PEZI